MDEGNELETLLVLCCLVGVIVFLCFSLSAVNLSAQVDTKPGNDGGAAARTPADLPKPEELERAVASLTSERDRLAKEVNRGKQEIAGVSVPEPGDRASELASLQRQLDEISKAIERLKAEQDRLKQSGIERSDREREQSRLKGTLEQLRGEVEEKRKLLAAIPVSVDASMETDLRKLRDSCAGLGKQISELSTYLAGMKEEPGTFNIQRNLSGNTTLKHPAIVECKKNGLVFYPEGKEIATSALKSQNPFKELPGKPDGILFLIRPDGFESFRKGFELAEGTSLPIIFEAVDANLRLKF